MKRKSIILLLSITVILLILNIFPLPYYVTSPGMAKELDGVIEVEDGYRETGEFMLTTVSMGKANIFTYFIAKMRDYYELEPVDSIRYENESDEEYRVRQLYLMESSQENAMQVAYKKAGKQVEVEYNGIYVLGIMEGMPAERVLRPGDRIVAIDGHSFQSTEAFTDYVQGKNTGDTIHVTFIREGEERTGELTVEMIPEIGKPGIGITLVEDKKVETDPPVFIDTDQIGGPSAGLMFSLEMYNQLTEEDITKGYLIAGTGTINEQGEVGPIGGIEQKIVAAHQAGAEIFFAPREKGKRNSNYEKAVETAKDIGTDMAIVPVDRFDDALEYLKRLDHKEKS